MRTLLIVLLLFVAGRAMVQAQSAGRSCSVDAAVARSMNAGEIYRDCDVDQPAHLRRDARPSFSFPAGQNCVTAELVFVVDTTGIPDTTTAAVQATDSPDFARLLVASLPDWRYRPARLHGVAVRQAVLERRVQSDGRVPFVLPPDARTPGTPPPASRTPPCR